MGPCRDKTKSYIPLAGGAEDGWSNKEKATATCYCGAVQLAFVSNFPANLTKISDSDLSNLAYHYYH